MLKNGFLFPAHRALDYLRYRHAYWMPEGFSLIHYLHGVLRWAARVSRDGTVCMTTDKTLTVIVLSYRRIRNIEPIVWALLKASFIDRIVVSNVNRRLRLRDWVSIRDGRLELIDEPRIFGPGRRFELARLLPGDFFLSVDDDLFVTASQIRDLFEHLHREPDAPHGIKGELLVDHPCMPKEGWIGVENRNSQVDVLNELYLFTRAHLDRMYALADRLGIHLVDLQNGEDVLLSCSGPLKPVVRKVGSIVKCPSAYRQGIATWNSRANFFRERRELFTRAAAECDLVWNSALTDETIELL